MSDKNDLRNKINPKAITALIMEKSNRENAPEFIHEAYLRVFDRQDLLTEEWVSRINQWAKKTVKDMVLDEPPSLKEGDVISLGPLKITKKIRRHSKKKEAFYNDYERFIDYIAIDASGWKFWFRVYKLTSDLKAQRDSFPKRGSYVLLEGARVNENRTGITFLSSVKKIIETTNGD